MQYFKVVLPTHNPSTGSITLTCFPLPGVDIGNVWKIDVVKVETSGLVVPLPNVPPKFLTCELLQSEILVSIKKQFSNTAGAVSEKTATTPEVNTPQALLLELGKALIALNKSHISLQYLLIQLPYYSIPIKSILNHAQYLGTPFKTLCERVKDWTELSLKEVESNLIEKATIKGIDSTSQVIVKIDCHYNLFSKIAVGISDVEISSHQASQLSWYIEVFGSKVDNSFKLNDSYDVIEGKLIPNKQLTPTA